MIEQIFINETTLNSTAIITNISQQPNLTIKLVMEIQNASLSAKVENANPWYDSAIFGVIVGAVLTLLTTIIGSWINKKIELTEYEYRLLSYTTDLMDKPLDEKLKSNMKSFVDQINLEPKFSKIQSHDLVVNTLIKLMKGEQTTDEKENISKRIKHLRKSFWSKF